MLLFVENKCILAEPTAKRWGWLLHNAAEFLILGGGLPPKARLDALHIACASYHAIDVLITWNCTHIANPAKLPVMRGLCAARGYKLPEVVTPFELMEVSQ